ncbi:hypothetical protein V1525DRAFT_394180 [Lipomyces kononenkoae]|uniref:Uncharacterized protein n=1 Tax=Lipomyces kononenkoae TaxID=34357 RepID=A0ACC3TB13_LIPKO
MSKLPDLLRVFDGTHLPLPRNKHQLVLITSALATNSSWLLQHFVRASLAQQRNSITGIEKVQQKRPVIFVSLIDDVEFHRRCFMKAGIDLDALIAQKLFIYVDGFTKLFGPSPDLSNSLVVYLQSADKATWLSQIRSVILQLEAGDILPTLVLEGLDVLHALGIMSAKEILRFVHDLQELSGVLIASSYSSDIMLTGMSTLAVEQNAYLLSLIRRAVAVFSIRPLSTGMAGDVTGTIRITNGGQPCDGQGNVDQGEFHYFVGEGKSGGVKVFEKGHG